MQDAVNLGWKLAQVVKGLSPESLLDSYHTERHLVGARVLHNALAQLALLRQDDRTKALHDNVSQLLDMHEPRTRFGAMMSGLDIHYSLACPGEGNRLLGYRMPDLDLVTADGPTRVFSLLHAARPVLLNFAQPGALDIAPWSGKVGLVDAKHVGEWELPVLGVVHAPDAVLMRPDGHIAWVGDAQGAGLTAALTAWFGPPVTETPSRAR